MAALSERRIIRGAFVLALDGRRSVRKTDILIEDGALSALGGIDAEADILTDARGVVMPGLVQLHLHLTDSLLDGGFAPHVDPRIYFDVQLPSWRSGLSEETVSVGFAAGMARSLAAGATTIADPGRQARTRLADVARRFGARIVICAHATSPGFAQDAGMLVEYAADEEILPAVAIEDAANDPISKMRRAAAFAEAHDLPILACATRYDEGSRGVARLAKAGALSERTSVSFLRRIDKSGARALGQAKATVVLSPGLDLLIGAPPPPIDRLLEAGVPLALGSHSNVTRLDHDLFAEARLVLRFLEDRDDAAGSRILEMMGPNPARALGLAAGSVEVGNRADLILLDVEADAVDAHETLARRVIKNGGPHAVRTTWAAGRVVASDGVARMDAPPSEEEEAAVRGTLSKRVTGEIERTAMKKVFGLASRALWRARGWRI